LLSSPQSFTAMDINSDGQIATVDALHTINALETGDLTADFNQDAEGVALAANDDGNVDLTTGETVYVSVSATEIFGGRNNDILDIDDSSFHANGGSNFRPQRDIFRGLSQLSSTDIVGDFEDLNW